MQLEERLRRGSEGWRHRLALIEAAELSWFVGDRVSADRLTLWIAQRLSGAQEDTSALSRVGWAVRRLTGGPGPEASLADFLDRRDPENVAEDTERFTDRADTWRDLMTTAHHLHPISRACVGFQFWDLAGLGKNGDRMEAAVTAARIAVVEAKGAVFAPVAMGEAGGLGLGGTPVERLGRWLDGIGSATLKAKRHLDAVAAWAARAQSGMAPSSGRTAPALFAVLTEWPLVSAPIAEAPTGVMSAAVQRNLAWMEAQGLIREVTGQGKFRMWRADI